MDRFTRDEASAKVWWPFALVLVLLLVVSFPAEKRAITQERERATRAAVAIIEQDLIPATSGLDLSRPLSTVTSAALTSSLTDSVLEETDLVTTIRLWDRSGRLLYTTDRSEVVGSAAALNDRRLALAAQQPGIPVAITSDTTLTGDPSSTHDQIYVSLPGSTSVIAEVQVDDDALLSGLRSTWLGIKGVLAIAGLFVLMLAGPSIREPLAKIGAGVPFIPTSVPAGLAIVSHDEAIRMRQASDHARAKVAANQQRIEELELATLHLEGDLQRALSSLAITGGRRAASVIERAPAVAAQAPVAPVPLPAPLAKRAAAAKPTPAPSPRPIEPKIDERDVTVVVPSKERVVLPEPEPAAASIPETPVERKPERTPERKSEPKSEPVPVARVQPARRSSPRPAAPRPAPEVVPVPEAPAVDKDVVRIPNADGSGRDGDVIEVLERLVTPAGGQSLHPELDPGEVRARLAKTAASKKPGSRDERFRDDHS